MHAYENTKYLKPYLDSHADQIRAGIENAVDREDEVQLVAEVLSTVLAGDPEVQAVAMADFWKSIDWRLLADMYLGLDAGSPSI